MESPDALAQLLGTGDYPMEGAGALRIAFTEEMSKARWRDQGFGVPQDAIEVITEPGLLGAARGDSGLAMINMRPGAETIKAPGLHQSYNTIIQGDYAGGLGRSVPAPTMFPDTFAFMQREGRSPSSQLGSLMMDPKLYQKADENWLTGILDYLAKNPTALSAAGAAGLLGAVAPEEAEAGTSGLVASILRAFGDDVSGATNELVRVAGFPRETAERIATGRLPMDEVSRRSRKEEQGYGPTFYHGAEGEGFINVDPLAPGTTNSFAKGTGLFASSSPDVASSYIADLYDMRPDGVLMPLTFKGDNVLRVDADGSGFSEIFVDGDAMDTNTIARAAKRDGFDRVEIDNVYDPGAYVYGLPRAEEAAITAVALNPNTVRSTNAAFDPEYFGPNIMGATAGLGTAGILGAIAAGQRADNAMAVAPRSETLQQINMGLRDVERRLEGSPASLLFPEGLVNYLETVNRPYEDPTMLTRAMALIDLL